MTSTPFATGTIPLAPAAPRRTVFRGALRAAGRVLAGPALGPIVGLVVALVSAIRIGVPSFWGDEAATIVSATRPWGALLAELTHVDSVHGLYYAIMHVWVGLFGTTETAARMPSVIAGGLAAWGVVVLGRSLFGARVGVIAAALLLVIPEFTRIAIEARSYAIGAALAVWITVLLVRNLTSRRRRGWVLYAVAAAVSVAMFEFLGLLVLAHVVLLWALRAPRTAVRRWVLSLAAATPIVLLVVVQAYRERAQVAFLADHDYGTPYDVLVEQWFRSPSSAVLLWTAVLAGVALTAVRIRALRSSDQGMPDPRFRPRRRRMIAIAVWAFLPTLAIVAINEAIVPIYNERYVAFCIPAVALVAALGIDGVLRLLRAVVSAPGRRRAAGAAVVAAAAAVIGSLLVAAAAPPFLGQRGPYGKDNGADLRQAAALLHRVARPGDAVVFTELIRASEKSRLQVDLYPRDFAGLDDVELAVPNARTTGLWDQVRPIEDLGSRLTSHRVVWADEVHGYARPDLSALESLGYRVTATLPVHRTVLYRLVKETP